jgi:hypothetical protein
MNQKQIRRSIGIASGIAGTVLVGAALYDQLRMQPEQRTWQGQIAGIPYDFRRPTLERLRERLWNPDSSSILTPKAFGVGWDINFYALLHPGR